MNDSIRIIEQVNPSWGLLTQNIAPDYLTQITPELARARKLIMVIAQEDYDYIGYSLLAPKSGSTDTYRLIHTLVIPENCRDGVATAMLDLAIEKLRKYGVKYLEAAVLEEDTEEALPFLESNGFALDHDRHIMTYPVKQLSDTEFHSKPASPFVHPIAQVAPKELVVSLKGKGLVFTGLDTALSGVLIKNGVYEGFADISLTDDGLSLNSITIDKDADEKVALLQLWKYASDKLIEAGSSSGLNEAVITVNNWLFIRMCGIENRLKAA